MMILTFKILKNLRGVISDEEEVTNEEAIMVGNCAKLAQSEYKEHLI